MGKNTRGDKEYSRLQQALHENAKLKREISRLRKQYARLDLDRHEYVKSIVDEHYAREQQEETTEKMLGRLKEEWRCRVCKIGYLEIIIYNRLDGTFYYRHCNNCIHRTTSQKYDPNKVKGPVKNVTEDNGA